MITYKLSRREKALLYVLAVVVVIIAWYFLVFQNTTSQIAHLEAEISNTQTAIDLDTARVSQLAMMKKTIEERQAEGATTTQVPEYDNMQPLMNELNAIMSAAETYTLTFDELDRDSGEYVYRGVRVNFSCGSYATAESVIIALANGKFPCVIDSIAIVDNSARSGSTSSTATSVSGYAHVTFFEKNSTAAAATATASSDASSSSAAA